MMELHEGDRSHDKGREIRIQLHRHMYATEGFVMTEVKAKPSA